jgi:chromosome segregation ATPase
LSTLFALLLVSSLHAADRPSLIPGYVDADGRVHPEKLLSYVDALHRAADAEVAEARITQLEGHLSQVVATLNRTRQQLARQTKRADAAEQLADTRGKEVDRMTKLHRISQANLSRTVKTLQTTRNALLAQTTRTTTLQAEQATLRKKVTALIVSVQTSQAMTKRVTTELDKSQASLASVTAARNAVAEKLERQATDNLKLKTKLSDTSGMLAKANRSLESAVVELAKAKADLKAFADKTKPAVVEPDAKPANKPEAVPVPKSEPDDS